MIDAFRYLPWWFWLSVFLIGVAIGYHAPDLIK